MDNHIIKVGDYIIVQRQNYTKLHKLKKRGTISLGNFIVELDNIVGCKYFDTFQMLLQPNSKKLYSLEKVEEVNTVSQLNIQKSGVDNRNITDDSESQTLTTEEIAKLREVGSSNDIVEKLIANSKTFSEKTEYSQEKYMKKKEKKYYGYIQVRKPTIRILTQMFYRQDPGKTLGLRMDDLSQILTYSNIQSVGNHILYDSGTSGLVTAALLNAIGVNTSATLIHMHPGNECQKNAVIAMHFPPEQLDRCVNVNLYSVLRCYYQNKDTYSTETKENSATEKETKESSVTSEETKAPTENVTDSRKRKLEDDEEPTNAKKKPCWQYENEKACRILENKVDSLVVVAKDHPINLVKELLCFLKGGRNLVVFSLLKEPLQDLFVYLKERSDFISIRLSTNFMRNYQVLPGRTHPEMLMNCGGYTLTAVKLVK